MGQEHRPQAAANCLAVPARRVTSSACHRPDSNAQANPQADAEADSQAHAQADADTDANRW